jgi:Ca2+-binding EF-hand superfamily protein
LARALLSGSATASNRYLNTWETFMFKLDKSVTTGAICAVILAASAVAQAQGNEFATGNMHFDAKEMDTNGDHMITREEMVAYAQKTWEMMAHGRQSLAIDIADKDFASGGVNYKARAIDTDHDGTISQQEFVAYATRKFESMKKSDNMVSVDDMARAIARGNTYPAPGKS